MNLRTPYLLADWTQSVSHGDLVLSRFPFPSTEDCQTRTLRPCLVLDRDTYLGATFLALVPGVSVPRQAAQAGDLLVDETALFAEAQHLGPIRFLPDLTDRVDTAHRTIFPDGGASPVIGRVYGSMLDAVEHMRGQHLALREQHMAAYQARRARRRRPAQQ